MFSVNNTELSLEVSDKKIEGELFNLRLRTETQQSNSTKKNKAKQYELKD
jgi:hypothetical protein